MGEAFLNTYNVMSDKNINKGIVDFGEVDNDKSIIKVVGVGGGGGNAGW